MLMNSTHFSHSSLAHVSWQRELYLFVCTSALLCSDPLKTIKTTASGTSASSSPVFVFIKGQTWQTVALAKQLQSGHPALCQAPCSRVGCQHWANARLVQRQSQHPFQMSADVVQSSGIPDIPITHVKGQNHLVVILHKLAHMELAGFFCADLGGNVGNSTEWI